MKKEFPIRFPSPVGRNLIKLRYCFFISGGLLLQLIIVALWISVFGFSLSDISYSYRYALHESFIIITLILVTSNLIPMKICYMEGFLINDGMRLIKAPFIREEGIQEILATGLITDAHEAYEQDNYALAEKLYQECLQQYPLAAVAKINYCATLLKLLKFDDARNILLSLLAEKHDTFYDALIYNNLAWCFLLKHDEQSLINADDYSKMAFSKFPQSSFISGTRGCIMIERGSVYDGIKLLKKNINLNKEVDKKTNNPVSFFFIGYGYFKNGQPEKAEKYLQHLNTYPEKLDPDYEYLFNIIKNKTNYFDKI